MALLKKLRAWSYSTWSAYQQCPLKVKLTKLDKLPEPSTTPLAGGSVKHKQVENFIKGLPTPVFDQTVPLVLEHQGWPPDELYTRHTHKQGVLPPELKHFAADLKALKTRWKQKSKVTLVEADWAFTERWTPTGWFDKDAWLRVKLDCAYLDRDGKTLILRDWKSGRFKEEQSQEYLQQLELYALTSFIQLPYVQAVKPQLDYLDAGKTWPPAAKPVIYAREELGTLKAAWTKRAKPMMADSTFAPRPNRYCGWCHFRKANGGPCQY